MSAPIDPSSQAETVATGELAARWQRLRTALRTRIGAGMPFEARLAAVIDAIWEEFGEHRPVSWAGFYSLGADEMTLVYRRDKPACSPIGLHGACGKSALSGQSLIVPDVRALGEGYIACDPRDLAELVVPVRDSGGTVIGVVDVDSYSVGAFGAEDCAALEGIVREFLEQRPA